MLLGTPMAVCDGRWGTREDRGHGKRRSRTGMARVGGAFGWPEAGQWRTGTVRLGVEWLAVGPGRD